MLITWKCIRLGLGRNSFLSIAIHTVDVCYYYFSSTILLLLYGQRVFFYLLNYMHVYPLLCMYQYVYPRVLDKLFRRFVVYCLWEYKKKKSFVLFCRICFQKPRLYTKYAYNKI